MRRSSRIPGRPFCQVKDALRAQEWSDIQQTVYQGIKCIATRPFERAYNQ